jgi:hypothetical protein
MDLDRRLIEARGYGDYERLDHRLLPPLYLAYKPQLGKVRPAPARSRRLRPGETGGHRNAEKIAATAGRGGRTSARRFQPLAGAR